MRVLIDVDGVVAGLLAHLWDNMETDIKIADLRSWHIIRDLPERESQKILELFKQREFWRTLPVMPGAKEGIQKIRDAGHDIVWLTAPYTPCYGWASERFEWLGRNFDAHYHDICIAHRKGCISGDVLIDDKPENVREWQQMNPSGRVFLYAHAFNVSEPFARMTWDSMPEFLTKPSRG